jgi:alanine racemase
VRPVRAVVDLDALRHNIQVARRLAPRSRVLAVVKADAYGHGAVPTARAMARYADAFAVAGLEEALQLRAAGLEHRIILLAGFFTGDELPALAARRR